MTETPAKNAISTTDVADAMPNWGRLVSSGYGTAAWNRRDPDEYKMVIPSTAILFYFKPCENRESRLGGTRTHTVSAAGGSCFIIPAGADYWARWHEPKETASFSIAQSWLDDLAASDFDMPAARVLGDGMPIVDCQVALLGGMLRDELRSSSTGTMASLELDSILNLLGLHLLRAHGVARPPRELGGLSDRQFRQLRDYMMTRLAENVRLDELAGVVGLSSSQMQRSFRRRTGTSPHQFLTRLRLDQARSLITGGPMPLAEVAIACGFSSQSHLTAIMRRADGLTPGALRG